MAAKSIPQGVLKEFTGYTRYIVVNPADVEKAVDMLQAHIAKIYKPIDVYSHEISIRKGVTAIALSSGDPSFSFGINEHGLLFNAGVKHLLASRETGFVHVHTVRRLRSRAQEIGL